MVDLGISRSVCVRFCGQLLLAASACLLPGTALAADTNATQPTPSAANSHANALNGPNEIQLTPEQMGDIHMARKRYEAALSAYHKAPRSALIWNKIGIAEQQMGMLDAARISYETSLKMNSQNADTLNNLATVYYATHQYKSADKMYRKALKLDPHSALVYKNLGTDLMAWNKFQRGWECYVTALSFDPQIFEKENMLRIGEPASLETRGAMSFYLAKSYVMVGKNDLAVEYLRKAIEDGFTDRKKILADKQFASLHGNTSFDMLVGVHDYDHMTAN